MVSIKSSDWFLEVLVIVYPAVFQAEPRYLVLSFQQVKISLLSLGISHVCPNLHGVTGHVNRYVTTQHLQHIHIYLPACLALGSIGWNGVAKRHVDYCIFNLCLVESHGLGTEVDTMTGSIQSSKSSVYPQVGNQFLCIQAHGIKFQSVYFNIS